MIVALSYISKISYGDNIDHYFCGIPDQHSIAQI